MKPLRDALVLSFALMEVTFSLNAHASMITTSQAISDRARAENLSSVQNFLDRVGVQYELIRRGAAPAGADVVVILILLLIDRL